MEETSNLSLPFIMPSQAQKHVTHNEALVLLDAMVQLSVKSRQFETPPEATGDGDRYLVAAGATGDWSGWDHSIALSLDGGWRRFTPATGWLAWIADEDVLSVFDGFQWTEVEHTFRELRNLKALGIGTSPDTENPFAAKLNKALWSALAASEGGDGDLRYTMNKESAGNVLSLLMQSNWAGRAELGLVGDDDLTCSVSADGDTWVDALRVSNDSGRVSFPSTPALDALSPLSGAPGNFVLFNEADEAIMRPVVGEVAQIGGVPTGSIVERISNGNGTCIRFADGTQICHHSAAENVSIDTAFGGGYRSDPQNWTFPAAFAVGSTDEIAMQASAGAVSHSVQAVATSETAGVWYHMQPGSAPLAARPATLLAFGRWF